MNLEEVIPELRVDDARGQRGGIRASELRSTASMPLRWRRFETEKWRSRYVARFMCLRIRSRRCVRSCEKHILNPQPKKTCLKWACTFMLPQPNSPGGGE